MLRPICVTCQSEHEITTTGVAVVLVVNGEPDTIWSGDLWTCPICQKQTVSGFGKEPFASSDWSTWNDTLPRVLRSMNAVFVFRGPMSMDRVNHIREFGL